MLASSLSPFFCYFEFKSSYSKQRTPGGQYTASSLFDHLSQQCDTQLPGHLILLRRTTGCVRPAKPRPPRGRQCSLLGVAVLCRVKRAKGCAALLQGPGLVIEDHFERWLFSH